MAASTDHSGKTSYDEIFRILGREMDGIEFTHDEFDSHRLRHTHATELSEAGVNIKEIQRRRGHSTLEITTRRYIHATDRMEQESIDIMNRMYGCENGQSQE